MTRASLAALLLLCAGCDRHAPPAMQAKPAVAAKADDDSGQGRAEAAGRELLGRPAPALTLTTLDGQRIDLAKAYGEKPVYLKFWATWCVPCRQQMPAFEKDYQDLKDKVTIVAVNTGFNETPEGVAAYRQKLSLTMPVVIDDGRLAQALNLRVTPQHVVVGRDGRILYVGHLEDDKLHQAFAAALAEQGKPGATGAEEAREPVFRVGDQPTGLAATTTAGAPFPLTGANPDGKPRVLVFFSPWCEGYLAQSRPEASKACRRVREEVNAIAPKGQADWLGVASGLWASAKDLSDYQAKPGSAAPLTLDETGRLFRAFDVHDVPTVVLIDAKGRVARKLGPSDAGLAAAVEKLAKG